MFDVCVDDNAGENESEGDGEWLVQRPLERVPPLGVASALLHRRDALGQLAGAPPPQRLATLTAATLHAFHYNTLYLIAHDFQTIYVKRPFQHASSDVQRQYYHKVAISSRHTLHVTEVLFI